MSKNNNFQERRKHKRFETKRGVFAVSPPGFDKLGQIKNISKGGLVFQYSEDKEQARDLHEVEIFSTSDDFFLRKLPVRTVLDYAVEPQVLFSSSSTRQVSLQFEKLSYNQKILLDYLLKKYTRK